MTDQKEIFLRAEGDNWYQRNQNRDWDNDPLVSFFEKQQLRPLRILEIGCCDGGRLDQFQRRFGSICTGIDPSEKAVQSGTKLYPNIKLVRATADNLPFPDQNFDFVIYGFCLCVCDPADMFRIAAEGDRVLACAGSILVYDFVPPHPFTNDWVHYEGLKAYKMDYSRLFSWHPAYRETMRQETSHTAGASSDHPNERASIIVMKKQPEYAFGPNPWVNQ